MYRERKIAIATLLFAGMIVLPWIYDIYRWYGVAAILGVITLSIGMLSIEEETKE